MAALADGADGNGTSISLSADGTSSIEIGTAGNAAAGTVTIDAGVTMTETGIFSAPRIVNDGTIIVSSPQFDGSNVNPASGFLTLSGTRGLTGRGEVDLVENERIADDGVTVSRLPPIATVLGGNARRSIAAR